MSLPAAPKDISEHPISGSVVDPVNKAAKNADVDRKIRLFGVIEAFRRGRMPDNKQIDDTLKYVIDNSPVDTSKLSREGRKLIQDTRDIIETARLIVAEKNADELFQNFVWHTSDIEWDKAKKDPNDVLPVDKAKAKDDAKYAARHLRTILSLILTNSEARKLLSDLSVIGRDLLAMSATKVAEIARPDEEQLARVDDTAPSHQFVTEEGRTAGPHETPIPQARIPGTDTSVAQHPKDDLGTGAHVKDASGQVNGQQAYAEGSEHLQNGVSDTEKKTGLMDKVRGLKDNIADMIPQQKEKVQDKYDHGKHFLTEEYFPEERRDQFIFRAKKVIIECQKHDDYQDSLRWLLGYIKEYAEHTKTITTHGKDSHKQLTSDESLQQATTELRNLLERFANGQSIDPILDATNVLIDDANDDPEFRDWFRDVDAYIRKVLLEPGYVLEPNCNKRATELKESGHRFFDDKYRDRFDRIFSSIGNWFKAMGEDPLNVRFGEDWGRLTRDLLFDSEGSLKFKTHLWSDIRKVILPTLVDKVGYIPIPRVEYTDDSLDLVVENLTLSGRNLFPNYVTVDANNFIKFSPYNAISDKHHHEFTLTLGQIQADMRDVAFYFRKKTGIPKMADSGIADVILGGEGMTATIHLVSADKDKSSVFKVKHVHVKVDTLKFSIRDSKHDFLYKTLKPLATGLVKKQIQKAIAGAITTGLEYVDGQLVTVRDRVADAKETEGVSRIEVLQDLFKHKQSETQSGKSSERGSHFTVATSKRNSLLASHGHPAGWINRASEREEAAATGQEWRSEAFSIVGQA